MATTMHVYVHLTSVSKPEEILETVKLSLNAPASSEESKEASGSSTAGTIGEL